MAKRLKTVADEIEEIIDEAEETFNDDYELEIDSIEMTNKMLVAILKVLYIANKDKLITEPAGMVNI